MKSAMWLLSGYTTLLVAALLNTYAGWHPTETGFCLIGIAVGICYGRAFP